MNKQRDKRQLIFDATEQLMNTVPIKDISVEAIAKQAGIGKGSVYYYFESKEEILSAVVENSYRRAVHDYFESIRSMPESSSLVKVRKLFQSILKKDYGKNEKNLIPTLHLHDDWALHTKMKYAAMQEIAPVLTSLIEEGVAEGSVSTDTPKESAEIIIAVLSEILDNGMFLNDTEGIITKLKILSGVLETCLKSKPGSFNYLYEELSGKKISNF